MSTAGHPRRRPRRFALGVARLGLVTVMVRLAVAIVGPAATSVLLATVLIAGGLVWWARFVEPRLFAPRVSTTAAVVRHTRSPDPSDAERHLAFARALALVANCYLAECEQRAGPAARWRLDDLDRPPTPGAQRR